MKKLILFILPVIFVLLLAIPCFSTTYHVTTGGSNTSPFDTWAKAAPDLEDIVESGSITLTAGDIIYINGTLSSQPIASTSTSEGGSNIHPGTNADKAQEVEAIDVSGSVVAFSTNVSDVSTTTDYVWVVNSFKGNSGVFKVSSVDGNNVTVDTASLPGGSFVTETDSPWTLKGAVIRPIQILGCKTQDDPSGCTVEGNANIASISLYVRSDYIYFSNLTLQDGSVPIRVAGGDTWGVDFACFDHVTIDDFTAVGVIVSGGEQGSNQPDSGHKRGTDQYYTVFQHCVFDHAIEGTVPTPTTCYTKEHIYHGRDTVYQEAGAYYYEWNAAYMYNEFPNAIGYTTSAAGTCTGGARSNTDGEAFDGKSNNRYTILWGNWFHDSQRAPAYGIVKDPSAEYVIANNYFDTVHGSSTWGVVAQVVPTVTNGMIFNNVFYNCIGQSIRVANTYSQDNAHVYNNTFYGRKSGDTAVYLNSSLNLGSFYNNIIQNYATGIVVGGAVNNDANNFFYDNTSDGDTGDLSGTVYTTDPGLTNPGSEDFSIAASSNAKDVGTDLSAYFSVDNHNAATPSTLPGEQSGERSDDWDIGAYEYSLGSPQPSPVSIVSGGNVSVESGGNVTIQAP